MMSKESERLVKLAKQIENGEVLYKYEFFNDFNAQLIDYTCERIDSVKGRDDSGYQYRLLSLLINDLFFKLLTDINREQQS